MSTAKTATKTIDTFATDAQAAVTENFEKATKTLEGAAAFGQETVDAVMKSQSVAAKALEELNAEIVAFTKKSVEESVAHAKDLASVQTVTEFVEKQTGFAKVSFDAMIKQSAKLNELSIAAAKAAFAPLTARATAAAAAVKSFQA